MLREPGEWLKDDGLSTSWDYGGESRGRGSRRVNGRIV